MNKKFLFLAVFLMLPGLVLAADTLTVADILTNIISNVVWPVGATVVIVFWILTGILFLKAQGAPEMLKTAKIALIWAVAGTVLVILAYSAINLVKDALKI